MGYPYNAVEIREINKPAIDINHPGTKNGAEMGVFQSL